MDTVNIINNGITVKSAAAMIGEVADHCREKGKPVTNQLVYRLIRQGFIKRIARGIVSLESVRKYVNARKQLEELKNGTTT